MPTTGVQGGFLVMADITGYTSFLTGNELEHANGIIEDLTRCVLEHLPAPLHLVKLEGDCAFSMAPRSAIGNGERILEIVESCYCAFSDHIADVQRATTCRCSACASIGTLDLKFVVHLGEFVVQRSAGVDDLAGPDVILVHRLLKNHVTEQTGMRAYALLTEAVVSSFSAAPALTTHSESVEPFGEIHALLEDLHPVAEQRRMARRMRVEPEAADLDVTITMAVPPAVAWDWWLRPELAMRWQGDLTGAEAVPNAAGRTGVLAELHCAHGKGAAVHRYVDVRPFEYLTSEVTPVRKSMKTPPPCTATVTFTPINDGRATSVRFSARLRDANRAQRMLVTLIRPSFRKGFHESEARFAAIVDAGEFA